MIKFEGNNKIISKNITEISLISPTIQLAQNAKDIIEHRNENIDIFIPAAKENVLSDALRTAKKLVGQGTKVIISRKGTAAAIRKAKLNVSIVEINVILSDYIEPIEIAKNVKGLVVFFFYGEIPDNLQSLCYMLDMKAKFYTFQSDEDCKTIVKQAIEEGAALGIGGAMTQKYSELYNLKHITIENSEEAIVNAIQTAKQILLIQKEEHKKQDELKLEIERYKVVLNFTHDAIISVDRKGNIDVINSVAERIVKVSPGYALGKNIDEIIHNTEMFTTINSGKKQLNQLMNINGTLVSTNRIPIIVDNEVKGAVATFQDVKVIQENETKIRRSLHEKGLFAKYIFSDIKGESNAIKNTIEIAKSYAPSDSTVLIQGETGTGKELFAQSIHNDSNRKDGPFVAINCAALSTDLLESELFGYVEGAFTGALKGGKIGLFELAHKGTIFLDEIGEIPIEIQAQLLRVLQEKEVSRVGTGIRTPVDVRVITATNRDLKSAIKAGTFREDLYYRISVLNLSIPPLRERKEDIFLLSKCFFEKNMGTNYLNYKDRFYEIIKRLEGYEWYGNIRELMNFIERVCVFMKYHASANVDDKLLNEFIKDNHQNISCNLENDTEKKQNANEKDKNLSEWEVNKIMNVLKKNNLSIQITAKELGVSRTTLWRKMKTYNINV